VATEVTVWNLELGLANVGSRFPTWEEVLAIVLLDVLLIGGAFLLFARSLRRSRRVTTSKPATSSGLSSVDGGSRDGSPHGPGETQRDAGERWDEAGGRR
jgi:hypothetical protein